MHSNPLKPELAVVRKIKRESPSAATYSLAFRDPELRKRFSFEPGQFVMASIFGAGEFACSISSSPAEKALFSLTVVNLGRVTAALSSLRKGSVVGIRGPFGRPFPLTKGKGKQVNLVAGGSGLAPLKSVIEDLLSSVKDFTEINLFYGARSPKEFLFKRELNHWKNLSHFNVLLTADKPFKNWRGSTGFVHELLDEELLHPKNSLTLVCGPPLMLAAVSKKLLGMGFSDKDIFASLERLMYCGIGKCNHCAIGEHRVCVEGPVFDLHSLRGFPHEK